MNEFVISILIMSGLMASAICAVTGSSKDAGAAIATSLILASCAFIGIALVLITGVFSPLSATVYFVSGAISLFLTIKKYYWSGLLVAAASLPATLDLLKFS